MKLPGRENAIISEKKVRDYVLSPVHPVGRFKAEFFRGLGYKQKNWKDFINDLRSQHLGLEVKKVGESKFGAKYEIEGNLKGPNGKETSVVTVWIVLEGESAPRFITAYPGE